MLICGESGSGKTGALLSLAEAGYKLRIIDTDNGSEILQQLARQSTKPLDIIIEKAADSYTTISGRALSKGDGFSAALKLFDKFPVAWDAEDKPTTFEKIKDWDNKTIVVIDSLTRLGEMALNFVQATENKIGTSLTQPQWGQAMRMLEFMLNMLCSQDLKCHVIVNTHIANMYDGDEKDARLVAQFPNAIGKKLPEKIGSYFNSTLYVASVGVGTAKQRKIYTQAQTLLQTKTPNPISVKPNYPLATGLAEYFADLYPQALK